VAETSKPDPDLPAWFTEPRDDGSSKPLDEARKRELAEVALKRFGDKDAVDKQFKEHMPDWMLDKDGKMSADYFRLRSAYWHTDDGLRFLHALALDGIDPATIVIQKVKGHFVPTSIGDMSGENRYGGMSLSPAAYPLGDISGFFREK